MAPLFFFAPLLVLAVAGVQEATAAASPLRQGLLCEARARLEQWYEHGGRPLYGGGVKDGVELHFAGTVDCNGAATPVLFANWSMKGVKPKHLFSALTNTRRAREWNTDLVKAEILKVYPKLQAQGVRLEFTAGPTLSNRKVYEWETYDTNRKGTEYWFVASTDHNKQLRDMDTTKEGSGFLGFGGTVEADNCLCGYRFRETKDGVEGVMTNTVNGHPPFGISPEFIASLAWGKTVDFVKGLQKKALELAELDDSQLWLPDSDLLPKDSTDVPAKCMLDEAWEELDSLAQKNQLLASGDDAPRARSGAIAGPCLLLLILAAFLLALAAFRVWSKPRYAALSEPVLSTDTEAPADSSA